MKLQVELNGYMMIFQTEYDIPENTVSDIYIKMYRTLKSIADEESQTYPVEQTINKNNEENTIPIAKISTKSPQEERPTFRKRLPNNYININDLTIEQAITENALVRCPECGQSHVVVVKDKGEMYVLRKDYDKKEFVVISQFTESPTTLYNICCHEDTDKALYFDDIQKAKPQNDIDFALDNDSEIFCPVCGKFHPFTEWKKAYDEPLLFFETEHLCDACGGETVEKVVKDKIFTKCETCGLEVESKNV